MGSAPVEAPKPQRRGGFHEFWERISEGAQLAELWNDFRADWRQSYGFYTREVAPVDGTVPRDKRWVAHVKSFFWAVMNKLTPARRVLLLLALVLLVFPTFEWQSDNGNMRFQSHSMSGIAAVLLLVLLLLEIADRVTMKRDLEIAREIQASLVPAVAPSVPGLEIAFLNEPANTVAGDYYDVFPRAPELGTYLIVVADVAGKSLPAALLMATLQASLRTLTQSRGPLLDIVLGLNEYACSHNRGGARFTTAFVAEYDPHARTLTFVNAGHNAPFVRRGSTLLRLESGGIPFGIQPQAPYVSATISLEPGDLLVIFTDGIVEAENNRREEYDEARLLAFSRANASLAPAEFLQRLSAEIAAFTGATRQHDDMTCMVVRVA